MNKEKKVVKHRPYCDKVRITKNYKCTCKPKIKRKAETI